MITNPNGEVLEMAVEMKDGTVNYALPGVRTFMPLFVTVDQYNQWLKGEASIGITGFWVI